MIHHALQQQTPNKQAREYTKMINANTTRLEPRLDEAGYSWELDGRRITMPNLTTSSGLDLKQHLLSNGNPDLPSLRIEDTRILTPINDQLKP